MIKTCREHLRGVCFDAFDQYEGENHRILLDDCVNVLKDLASSGKKVNWVANIPLSVIQDTEIGVHVYFACLLKFRLGKRKVLSYQGGLCDQRLDGISS